MLKKRTLFLLALLTISMYSNSQIIQKPDSIIKYEKAKYLKQDLNKFLSTHTEYPYTEMMNEIIGDVVFSFIINKNGTLEDLALVDSDNASLLNSSKNAINSLDGEWSPAKLDNATVDKKYSIVFRYRCYLIHNPNDYKAYGKNFFKKQKYEKALKALNSGIEENKYDYELYELRSKVREKLGDNEGAKKDQLNALSLKDEIISIIDITATGADRNLKLGTIITPVNKP
jgi:tetratricopeptide (TPR) repeat protein